VAYFREPSNLEIIIACATPCAAYDIAERIAAELWPDGTATPQVALAVEHGTADPRRRVRRQDCEHENREGAPNGTIMSFPPRRENTIIGCPFSRHKGSGPTDRLDTVVLMGTDSPQ
jgi:hypothetical protein